jgi:uncharacterized protein YndB with AHSA1/START domain
MPVLRNTGRAARTNRVRRGTPVDLRVASGQTRHTSSAASSWPQWPPGLDPASCPVFVSNQHLVPAPPADVWRWLCRADLWPTWFARSSNVRFRGGPSPVLGVGSRVVWGMLGATISVTVRRCEPRRLLDWEGGATGVHAYHAWLLEPAAGGTLVRTEETERGPLPWVLRWYLRGALHAAHQDWLESLARVAVKGSPAPGTRTV